VVDLLPPNQRVQPTPLRVERDRCDFESCFCLEAGSNLSMRRG
jgi:hypothetical protein